MIFGNTISMAHKSLDYLWKKQEITSNNIANVDTPRYKAKTISFEETFANKLKAASRLKDNSEVQRAIQESKYTVSSWNNSARVDQNNVNIDYESTQLARTTLHYEYLLRSVSGDISRFRSAAKGQ